GWYCLSGRAPEPGGQRPPLPLLVPGVPAALAAALEAGLREDRRLRPTAAELATAVYRSAAAEPVDLSGSVHPTVIPNLLTRHALPSTPRELRVQRLHGWSRHITRRIRRIPAVVPVRTAAPARPAARHAAGRNPDGHGKAGSAGAGRIGLRLISAVLALVVVLAGTSLLAGARLPWPFPGAPTPGPERAADGRSFAAPSGPAGPEAAAPATVPQDIQALLGSEDPAEAVRGLARLRSLAFNSGDLHLLDEVNAPESPAAAADGRIRARLRQTGHVLTGFSTVLGAVERAMDSGPLRTVLAVSVAQSAYQERDARGAIVAEAGAGGEQRLRLVLVPVNGRWRIQEILPGRPAPA
ncbi:MAG: serine/threonine protein kinase, partial [Arthrobacter sp.]|nr:serine/threonine protein kinase [Arthrobacter sp.]